MINPSESRYSSMKYRFCGRSGLKLPLISLGLWQNFGADRPYETQRTIVHRAFDLGITYFDLANNYGSPDGEAEKIFGKILREGLGNYREEMVISSKAGHRSWPGPYGDGGSRKYIIRSCEQSLRRVGIDCFDIFYHHRMDTEVPVEETMAALEQIVRQGKAIYVGVSSHSGAHLSSAAEALLARGYTRLTSVMSRYSLLERSDETDKWPIVGGLGVGIVAFCPLQQGLLTNKYLGKTAPDGSRFSQPADLSQLATPRTLERVGALNEIAVARGQTLAQMALAWVLHQPYIVSALTGASRVTQVEENVRTIEKLDFSAEELAKIDAITRPN